MNVNVQVPNVANYLRRFLGQITLQAGTIDTDVLPSLVESPIRPISWDLIIVPTWSDVQVSASMKAAEIREFANAGFSATTACILGDDGSTDLQSIPFEPQAYLPVGDDTTATNVFIGGPTGTGPAVPQSYIIRGLDATAWAYPPGIAISIASPAFSTNKLMSVYAWALCAVGGV